MLLALHNAFEANRIEGSAIHYILDRVTNDHFCRFIDGGAGIGSETKRYLKIFEKNYVKNGHVTCYEPLPENFATMKERLPIEGVTLRQVAISNKSGNSKFSVPTRMPDDTFWPKGTSFNGFLSERESNFETINIETVRIVDDIDFSPSFVKLDLQGGERDAVMGMGSLVERTKIFYIESQLLSHNNACSILSDMGFVIMFDKLQFGVKGGNVDTGRLREFGITVDRVMPNILSTVCYGHFNKRIVNGFLDYRFSDIIADHARTIGITYLQTDAICVNKNFFGEIVPWLDTII
jgi:FkbM family methyltransferase